MLAPTGVALDFDVGYVDGDGEGVTGLTVTVDVYRGATEVVTGGSATEVGDGLYTYQLASGSNTTAGNYRAVFKTTDTSVSQKHQFALWVVVPWLDSAGYTKANVLAIDDDTAAADNLEADYDNTGYNKANSTIGTTTTNTDMRGTDSAFLAASAPTNFSDLAVTATTGKVTVGTNDDKTDYALSSAGVQAIWDALTSALVTVGSIGKLLVDNVNATISSRSSHAAADVWSVATRVLTAGTNIVLAKDTGVTGFNDPTAAAIADATWDEVITGAAHNVNNSAARFLREAAEGIGLTGTAQAGAASTITLATGESATSNLYNGERIFIIEGTGAGQSRLITAYDGGTKVATVDRNWTVNPSSDSVYSIVGADVDIRAIEGDDAAADNLKAMFDGTGYAGGSTRLDVNTVTIEGSDATDQINAAADTALTDYDPPTRDELTTDIGTVTTAITGLNDPTAAAVADAVWDEPKSGHVGAGSFGEEVQAHALTSDVSAVETDTQDIQSRLPAVLSSGNMKADVLAINTDTAAAAQLARSAATIVNGAATATTLSTTQMSTNLTEATNDHYNGRILIWTSGVLQNQATDITDYDGTAKTLTFTAVTEAPSNSDTFVIV